MLAILAAIATLGSAPHPMQSKAPAAKPIQLAAMCTKTGERVSGMNKICTYKCLSGEVAITISSVALCPLTIDR